MARYTNIVSFDDVKAASKIRRAQSTDSESAPEGIYPGRVYYDLSRFASTASEERQAGLSESRAGNKERSSRTSRSKSSSSRATRASRKEKREDGVDSKKDSSARSTRASRKDSQSAARNSRRAAAPSRARRASDKAHTSLFGNIFSSPSPSPNTLDSPRKAKTQKATREQRRSDRTKKRADKLFDKQYDFSNDMKASDVEAASTPRAALYEGQMGSTHRKAARMQRVSEAGSSMAKINPAGWFANLNVSPRRMKIGTAVLCLVMAVVLLYTPAQHYYQSLREHDRLQAEYAVVEQRNQALEAQNESLASDAGMEDAVRQKYGYIVSGDEPVIVSGLSDSTTASLREANTVEANVLSSSVKAPEEWYTPYLDTLFGVS